MDGLRLALLIAGIAVIAAVYYWTARRRRVQREAGDFDSFGAWTDTKLDPLSDHDSLSDQEELTETNPRLQQRALDLDPPEPGPDAAAKHGTPLPPALGALDAVARARDERSAPRLGSLDAVDAVDEAPPRVAPTAPARAAGTLPRTGKSAAGDRAPPREEPRRAPEPTVVLNVMAPEGERFAGPALRQALENAGLKPGDMQLYHFHDPARAAGSSSVFSALNAVKPGTLDPGEMDALLTPGVALVMRVSDLERPTEAFELLYGTASRIADELGGKLCDETRSTLTRQVLNHLREQIADAVRRRRLGG